MDSNYWDSVYNQWKDRAAGVNADNYYDQSFIDRMNAAQQNIDNLVSAENQANSKVEASKDAYDTFKGEMRHYADISKEQEDEFGVQTAFSQYEKSKDAIAATQAMINALPSTINANSNRVLTQSQRDAAFQRQSSGYSNKLMRETSKASQYEDTWKQAREKATRASAKIMASEQNKLADFNKAWAAAVDNWYQAQENVRTAQYQKMDIESQYREWQRQEAAKERQRALKEMSLALDAYVATLRSESTIRQTQLMNDIKLRQNKIDSADSRLSDTMANIYTNYNSNTKNTNTNKNTYSFWEVAFNPGKVLFDLI